MEKKHFMGMLAAGAAALLLSTLPAGCTDGRDEIPSTGGRIGFVVDLRKDGDAAQAALTKGAQTKGGATQPDTLPAVSVIALEDDGSGQMEPLYLHAVTTDGIGDDATPQTGGARTKASPVDNATMYEEMSVTAFVYPASGSWPSAFTGGSTTSYMRTVRVKKTEAWSTGYLWPGAARRISFFAVAPYDSPGLTRLTDGSGSTLPYLSYSVPAGVADQKDLLVAASTDRPGNTNAAEALTMKHALTAVRFVTGDDMLAGTVSKITLKGVHSTGRLPLQASAAWYDLGGARDFAQTFSPEAVAPDPQAPDTPLTPETATFMMLPQTLPAGAKIEVRYTDGLTNTPRTLTANIAGKTWPMGKTVTYRISTSSIVITSTLEVTPPADYTYQGGNGSYTVKSYASVSGGGSTANVPIAWEVEYSEDGVSWNSTKPAWLTAFTESGAGGTSATSYTATVAAQVNSAPADPHTEALKNAAPVNDGTNTDIYDLSTHDGQGNIAPMRTANCYIVNAAGRYKLPLVYGNAVDYVKVPGGPNPGRNTSAYTSTATPASYILSPFINHLGNGITDPYIYNNTNCTPASCTLIWQDEKDLVTNIDLSSDGHFLEFTVGQATIHQGNAVVAVRDASNTVLWSWHIWVTDYKLGTGLKTITNYQHHHYTLMPVNLGWCDGKGEKTYAERTVQVRFKQKPTAGYTPAATQTFTVKQKAQTIAKLGNNTFYQWGRKDPFVGGILNGSIPYDKTWYDANGDAQVNKRPYVSDLGEGNTYIKASIRSPATFHTYGYSTGNDLYYNLWNADNTVNTHNDNPVVKTVYDPSPVGYNLPSSNVYTGFTTTGGVAFSFNMFNAQLPFSYGLNFYCELNKTGETVFLPSTGHRHPTSIPPADFQISPGYEGGYYWTSGVAGTTVVYGMYFSFLVQLEPLFSVPKISCFSVRAVQEE